MSVIQAEALTTFADETHHRMEQREAQRRAEFEERRDAAAAAGVEYAKELCGDCPFRGVCLDGALERREPWGVWGGELFEDGQVIPRKRPRGRPRKHPIPA